MEPTPFSDYLYKGLGRARLVLEAADPEPHRAALLDACLRNPVYDRQATGARADYYAALIALFPDPEWFRERILDALATDDETLDEDQLLDFALLFARGGDQRARQQLYAHADKLRADPDSYVVQRLIDLDGVDGFVYGAERLGQAFAADPDLWDDDGLLKYLEERVGAEVAALALERARTEQPFVTTYLDAIARNAVQPSTRDDIRAEFATQPYAVVKETIRTGKPRAYYGLLRQWGRDAPDDAFLAAARDLSSETEPGRLAAYASMFTLRPFPLGPAPLIPLAWHADEWVSFRAIQALAQLQDPAVRALALELVAARHKLAYVVELLCLNYAPGDERWLPDLVRAADDEDDLHRIGMDLNDVFAERLVPEAAPIFLELYERGPCQPCRREFVRRLIKLDAVPDWMVVEAAHDADEETRQAIADYTASKE